MMVCKIIIASNDSCYNQLMAEKLNKLDSFRGKAEIIGESENENAFLLEQIRTGNIQDITGCFLGTANCSCLQTCQSCLLTDVCTAFRYKQVLDAVRLPGPAIYYFSIDGNQNCTVSWPAAAGTLHQIISEEMLPANSYHSLEVKNESGNTKVCMQIQLSDSIPNDLQSIISRQVRSGNKVFYLPVMPGWQMHLCCTPDSTGPDLSALLLAIHQQCPPEAAKIGVFAQLHPDGYFQFRPPVRGDDLIRCEPEVLRQLLLLIREKMKQDNDNAFCWVDCRDISMHAAGRLAVLCDILFTVIPSDSSFAANCARRELGLMLANLPSECEIFENREQLLERLGL